MTEQTNTTVDKAQIAQLLIGKLLSLSEKELHELMNKPDQFFDDIDPIGAETKEQVIAEFRKLSEDQDKIKALCNSFEEGRVGD
jgi:hypothetical protein